MNSIKPLKWSALLLLLGIPAILNLIACKLVIPIIDAQQTFPIEITYFLSVGLIVLAPMFFSAFYLTSREIKSYKYEEIFSRMRIKKLSNTDFLWMAGGFIILSLLSFLIAKFVLPVLNLNAAPFSLKICL
ncbi:MAG: hypothetical protein K9I69_06660 [Ignavibacteriales bacterium]|nr:hypothetical protein [Ignavibacteriales bacterium]MCF8316585.1 hypothetical protein [Ignavibacteriales bacterium]MCF8438295.1 hypothetical protein [Ignavibacteriales bacterium]